MQKHVNLVDLVKSFPTNIFLQNLASIQKRTSPIKFAHFAEKSEKCSISNLSTKVEAHDALAEAHRAHARRAEEVALAGGARPDAEVVGLRLLEVFKRHVREGAVLVSGGRPPCSGCRCSLFFNDRLSSIFLSRVRRGNSEKPKRRETADKKKSFTRVWTPETLFAGVFQRYRLQKKN